MKIQGRNVLLHKFVKIHRKKLTQMLKNIWVVIKENHAV